MEHVLFLVDDEPHTFSSSARLLREEGYRAFAAVSGQGRPLSKSCFAVSTHRMAQMIGRLFGYWRQQP